MQYSYIYLFPHSSQRESNVQSHGVQFFRSTRLTTYSSTSLNAPAHLATSSTMACQPNPNPNAVAKSLRAASGPITKIRDHSLP